MTAASELLENFVDATQLVKLHLFIIVLLTEMSNDSGMDTNINIHLGD